uniref:Uncharacterized protein n=1 Tax=Anopheles christyi TaxID=43041 RepID=A0A182KFI2_9DIPT
MQHLSEGVPADDDPSESYKNPHRQTFTNGTTVHCDA